MKAVSSYMNGGFLAVADFVLGQSLGTCSVQMSYYFVLIFPTAL